MNCKLLKDAALPIDPPLQLPPDAKTDIPPDQKFSVEARSSYG